MPARNGRRGVAVYALLYGGPRTAPENASPADAATRAFYEQVSPLSAIPSFDPTGVS